MSWTHSSKGVTLALLVAVSFVAVGTAAAITVTGSVPGETQVGEQVTLNATISEPFRNAPDQWTLGGQTELTNASWTVTTIEQGRTIRTKEYGDSSFRQTLNIDNGTTDVKITVEGTVPNLTEYSYEDPSVENYTSLSLVRVVDGTENDLKTWQTHRYTEQSRNARQAIASAERAVANSTSSDAQNLLNNSKAFYGSKQFDRAIDNANQAEEAADQSGGGLPLIPIIGAVVVLVVIVAGVYYYRSQQGSDYKLQ